MNSLPWRFAQPTTQQVFTIFTVYPCLPTWWIKILSWTWHQMQFLYLRSTMGSVNKESWWKKLYSNLPQSTFVILIIQNSQWLMIYTLLGWPWESATLAGLHCEEAHVCQPVYWLTCYSKRCEIILYREVCNSICFGFSVCLSFITWQCSFFLNEDYQLEF